MAFEFCRGIDPYPGSLYKRILPEIGMDRWVEGNTGTPVIRNEDIPVELDSDNQRPFHLSHIVDIDVIINDDDPLDPVSRPEDDVDHLSGISRVELPVHGNDHFELGAAHFC